MRPEATEQENFHLPNWILLTLLLESLRPSVLKILYAASFESFEEFLGELSKLKLMRLKITWAKKPEGAQKINKSASHNTDNPSWILISVSTSAVSLLSWWTFPLRLYSNFFDT